MDAQQIEAKNAAATKQANMFIIGFFSIFGIFLLLAIITNVAYIMDPVKYAGLKPQVVYRDGYYNNRGRYYNDAPLINVDV